jgi:predicted dehydrogenase
MSDPLRIGVISTAAIGVDLVIPAIQRSERCEVVAISSRSDEAARTVAERLSIPRHHDSYDALLADPEVDAVYNPLPNHLHTRWNLAAIRAGKHLLAEKPFAMNTTEAEEVFAAAERADVRVVEAFMYRSHPTWQEVRRLVADGAIGELRHVQTYFGYHNLDPANIRNIVEFGGGALMDVGCYAVNSACLLFGGEPDVVGATMQRDHGFGTDTVTSALLRFPNGTAGFACATAIEPGQWVHVLGTEGRIDLGIPFNIPTDIPTFVYVTRGGDPPVEPDVRTIEFPACNQYTTQADAFAAHVLDGAPPNISSAESVATMRVIDRIVELAR